MGTRSITVVSERWQADQEYKPVATIYRHWDGYPEGHGVDLASFLDGLVLVNGIGSDMPEKFANGPGSLAAQLVSFLQEQGHNPNLCEHGSVMGQEYEYHVRCDYFGENAITVEVLDGPMTFFGMGGEECTNSVFKGTVAEYCAWVKKPAEAEAN